MVCLRAILLEAALPAGAFDLVSAQYPALRRTADDKRALLTAIASGRTLLLMYHADVGRRRCTARQRLAGRGRQDAATRCPSSEPQLPCAEDLDLPALPGQGSQEFGSDGSGPAPDQRNLTGRSPALGVWLVCTSPLGHPTVADLPHQPPPFCCALRAFSRGQLR